MTIKYSLIIPSFNEEKNLRILLPQITDLLNDFENLECVLVNNGSTDGTETLIKSVMSQNDRVRYVHVQENLGYGHGIKEGLDKATGSVIIWTHADLQTNLDDIRECIRIWSSNPERHIIVKGNRIRRGIVDRMLSISMSTFNILLNRVWISDINAQPNMLNKDSLQSIKNIPHDGTFDLYILNISLRESDVQLIRFPVIFHERIHGEGANDSIKSKIRYSVRSIRIMYQMRDYANYKS
jgi:glycosyltransferase involved in cell wall biosynthesis